jgi:integrase/recombinase XerD
MGVIMNQVNDQSAHIDSQSSLMAAMDIWEIYLLDQGRSQYTVKSFRGDIHLLTKFLPADKTIGSITTVDLNHFIEWLENGRGKNIPCSPKSLARRITTLKSFFRWLAEHGRIGFDPANAILQHSVISPLPEILTIQETTLVEETAKRAAQGENADHRPLALLKLLLETGIKKSECLNLKLAHIFNDENGSYIFVRYPDQKDRNKERKIPVSQEWMEIYQLYLQQYKLEDAVFPWSPRRLEYILEDIGTAAGLEKHLSFSMCRWNCALQDRRDGVDQDTIRQKMGISKIQWREISLKLKELSKTYAPDSED